MKIATFMQPLLGRLSPGRRASLRRVAQPAYLGALRRTRPLSERYGYDRGLPVDRYYIETFLESHRSDIRGRGLEIKSPTYLRHYDGGLTACDVLDIDPGNRDATVVADLTAADHLPGEQYDCFVLTQTLQFIYDWQAALRHARRILKPGGVLLVTVPVVSRMDRALSDVDYWRFTPPACERMFGDVFGAQHVDVRAFGNVLTASAFLMGLAAEDLRQDELDHCDPAFPVLVGVWAQRA